MNKEQNKKGRSSAIKISRHYQIQETKSMKDSGHEKDIAECGRTKIWEKMVWTTTKKTKQGKGREQQNNLNRERVRSGVEQHLRILQPAAIVHIRIN